MIDFWLNFWYGLGYDLAPNETVEEIETGSDLYSTYPNHVSTKYFS